ncbi:hypothetical protein TWF506_009437 [Arthrobotrys conoides]|uniref:Uncharacterized protein n=1 Tax=Arthrobotrys conoides TaxID=74498 RepID=A0AAN8NNJ2_9PEZI
MEAAGVWDYLPCILIKGVSDYADSHKNGRWQEYAAIAAAACAKAILEQWDRADRQHQQYQVKNQFINHNSKIVYQADQANNYGTQHITF